MNMVWNLTFVVYVLSKEEVREIIRNIKVK